MTDLEFIASLDVEKPSKLTFQLEDLAERYTHSVDTLNTLIMFSKHENKLVREGAIIGLMILAENEIESAKQELMKISINDPSEALRSIAESFCWYKLS